MWCAPIAAGARCIGLCGVGGDRGAARPAGQWSATLLLPSAPPHDGRVGMFSPRSAVV
ncbi:hypothetical protein FRAAL6280 [Frankia alni ACN14a]|uniref:Uncharacterized protein n=1 Tax=Frankia alni (strain DSM 45986 / CECT 9034 / ACN14a) TaxID=326424 RepID=Q0RCC3_FRAAA|nr:hypothetical protein FRAAL6280 [Frankia alni ACN14a]